MEARYIQGNQVKKAGWVELVCRGAGSGKCAAKESGIYGCKFDVNGNARACGAAATNRQTGDIDIIAAE